MLHFDLLTLFPDFFGSFLSESLIGKSIEKELLQVELNNFREYGIGSHRKVDDEPYGGVPGCFYGSNRSRKLWKPELAIIGNSDARLEKSC